MAKNRRWQRWQFQILLQRSRMRPAPTDATKALVDAKICIETDSPDMRICELCGEIGDGGTDRSGRLLQYDADKWVHVNCALWSAEVYESQCGALMNVEQAIRRGQHTTCCCCSKLGATVSCYKLNCRTQYHLPCAISAQCVFFKDKV